ncbi:Phytanoyl-CoA dioxygenase [Penicillium angulare]|uniref:Phytanoyl-CoA dioxygenase n=1 Tax=Penicillium angulare TaxID=116970 RepID=A0A9W9KPM5_9EURO|nr:Phytanoyl-CoA dioxygenase [Penicillium angulare]
MNGHTSIPSRHYSLNSIQLDDFKTICSRTVTKSTYPLSSSVEQNIPIYDLSPETINQNTVPSHTISSLQDEWHHILHSGPGVFVLKNMYPESRYKNTLSASNEAFNRIIAKEKLSSQKKGDHFAASGSNDRIWNSFNKHADEDPVSFTDYYSNPWLESVCSAWLGPGYKVTAQVNAVHPGGAAQQAHRDFHLGFQEVDAASSFPAATQLASQFLTLQGAVAHTPMLLSSGPTRFLPFSQTYAPGYLAWRREDFRAFFQENYVALPLDLGDGVFFNPALFHAAGANVMSAEDGFRRVANLLQVSSPFGKPMETVDSLPIVEKTWDLLLEKYKDAGGVAGIGMETEKFGLKEREVRAFVQAVGEGYAFPTNLDRRPPAPSGMAPESEQDVLLRGLEGGWSCEEVLNVLGQIRRDEKAF